MAYNIKLYFQENKSALSNSRPFFIQQKIYISMFKLSMNTYQVTRVLSAHFK